MSRAGRVAPPLVSTDWLAAELGAGDLVVADASVEKIVLPDGGATRRPARAAFRDEGHVVGAQFADLVNDFSDPSAPFAFARPDAPRMERAAGALGVAEKSRVVVYDRTNGVWAARLWWLLRAYGHDAVSVLDGGFKKWTREDRPVAFGEIPNPTAAFRALPRQGYFVDKPDVVAVVEGRAPGRLVCVLRPPIFSGEERVYARAGHIPGSLNIPYVDLIEAPTNAFRTAGELGRLLAPALAGAGPLILYCGGGVTAAGSALALTLLGVRDVAVYDGSLNEWTADPNLPLRAGP